jgi:hypothetical protein
VRTIEAMARRTERKCRSWQRRYSARILTVVELDKQLRKRLSSRW